MAPLREAVKQLQDARYIAVDDHNEYINLIEDMATELAWHLKTIGIEWEDVANEVQAAPLPQLATFEMGVTSAISKLREP